MNEIMKFENGEFGSVRTVIIDGEPWFVGKDLSKSLGYSQPSAMYKILDLEDTKEINPQSVDFIGSFQNGRTKLEPNENIKRLMLINESGLFNSIFGSKLEGAKKFKKWVTSEVLPQIRKTGGYIPIKFGDSQEDIENRAREILKSTLEEKDLLIALQQDKINKSNKAIKQLIPFYKFTKAVREGSGLMSLEEVAKTLFEHNGRIGRNTFIGILRDWKILNDKNLPYQKYINSGYFSVKFKRINKYDEYYSQPVTLVTGKGLTYLTNKILNEFSKDGAKDEM